MAFGQSVWHPAWLPESQGCSCGKTRSSTSTTTTSTRSSERRGGLGARQHDVKVGIIGDSASTQPRRFVFRHRSASLYTSVKHAWEKFAVNPSRYGANMALLWCYCGAGVVQIWCKYGAGLAGCSPLMQRMHGNSSHQSLRQCED